MLRKILGKHYNKFGSSISLKNNQYTITTDGVGTKILLADHYESIGHDVVNHCVNDVLCEGSFPLYFTSYIGMPEKFETQYEQLIHGIDDACARNLCKLIGGETAIMSDIYKEKATSVVGTMVGINKFNISSPQIGDQIIGFPSSGLHTNGYTTARKTLKDQMCDKLNGYTVKDLLLKPHSSYFQEIYSLAYEQIKINGICHLTGGGWQNLYRIINFNVDFELSIKYDIPGIFMLIHKDFDYQFMFNEFNMGIGMIVIINQQSYKKIKNCLTNNEYIHLGEVQPGNGEVRIDNKTLLREMY